MQQWWYLLIEDQFQSDKYKLLCVESVSLMQRRVSESRVYHYDWCDRLEKQDVLDPLESKPREVLITYINHWC